MCGEIMVDLELFLQDNPDMAEKPYGDAMAASLRRAFPCKSSLSSDVDGGT